ncbi:MAG: zinc-dependent alcohol dehydrogenase family protein [Thermodesulfobacteriota bacterium]|nr:zinc-dependent alcohol dehydrogenase family protein [Thermodesulfobacteriota bacterium]
MKAMVLKKIYNLKEQQNPLELVNISDPAPKEKEILVRVSACGICHTELDEIEGRTPPPRFPVVLGHQIVGRVEKINGRANKFKIGDRVGIGWIGSACGKCRFCLDGNENLCHEFKATGRDINGGYAQYTTVQEDFAYLIPEVFSDLEAAPLLCAGAIGYRSLRLTGMEDGKNLGLVGFGASAHLVIQMARYRYPNSKIFVFARTEKERSFARELGAFWTGDMGDQSPEKLDCAIDTTPAWKPIVDGLKNLQRGGRLVINAIRKEDIDKEFLSKLDYAQHLWMEKEIKSVANVARCDVSEFLQLAAKIPIRPEVQEFRLEEANQALLELKQRKIRGAKVLRIW